MTKNLTEEQRRRRADDLRRRAERRGDAIRMSFSQHLEHSAQRAAADAEEYGKAAEARRVKRRGSELSVDAQADEEATARELGLTEDELAVLRKVLGASARATDALETPLQRAQRAAAESCRLA